LQSTVYNNYTYEITLNTEIAKYRDALLNLLHPTGTQVIGRMAMYSNAATRYATTDFLSTANTIGLNNYSSATITAGTPAVPSNNIVKIVPIGTNNIANVIIANSSTLRFIFGSGVTDFVSSSVIAVNPTANTVTLKDNVWTYVANVARAVAQAGNNYILNIASSSVNTAVWNIINNGNYSNTAYPLSDIIHVGDTVYINSSAQTVVSVNPVSGLVTLSGALANGANGLVSVGRNISSTYGNTFVFTSK
jgi:hypothetical protein